MANKRIIGLFWLTAGLGMVAGGPAGANERGVADSPLTFSQEYDLPSYAWINTHWDMLWAFLVRLLLES